MNAKKHNLWEESLEDGFLSWIEKHGYSDKTRKTYQSMVFAYFDYLESKKISIESANKVIIEQFFKDRVINERTKVRYLWLVSDIYDDMVESGFISENNISIVLDKKRKGMRGKSPKRLPTVLSSNEILQLKDYIRKIPRTYSGMRKICALNLLLGTGLRSQELCDLETINLHLNQTKPYLTVIGKFDKERAIPIPLDIVADLIEYKDMKVKSSHYFLSSMANGNQYEASGVYRMVNTAMIGAGIVKAKMSPHVLRHTFCTTQIGQIGIVDPETNETSEVTLRMVMDWMGHDSIATTAIYDHVMTSINGANTVI